MFINFNCIYIYKYQTWIVVEYKLPLLIRQYFLTRRCSIYFFRFNFDYIRNFKFWFDYDFVVNLVSFIIYASVIPYVSG